MAAEWIYGFVVEQQVIRELWCTICILVLSHTSALVLPCSLILSALVLPCSLILSALVLPCSLILLLFSLAFSFFCSSLLLSHTSALLPCSIILLPISSLALLYFCSSPLLSHGSAFLLHCSLIFLLFIFHDSSCLCELGVFTPMVG